MRMREMNELNEIRAPASRWQAFRSRLKPIIAQAAYRIGFEIRRLGALQDPHRIENLLPSMKKILASGESLEVADFAGYCINRLDISKAQLFQDLFALKELDEKRGGYFVEFGATDGVTISNTFVLEKIYGWTGILAEPARCWHDALRANRSCHIDDRCVWSETGKQIEFKQTDNAEYSTIAAFADNDYHAVTRKQGTKYKVKTVSLGDLLREYRAPHVIDYLSVDTEGSELTILRNFAFEDYRARVITVEHNHSDQRGRIHELLTSKGYRRVFAELSNFDGWYLGNCV
jgi:FkbM family methyltransferase